MRRRRLGLKVTEDDDPSARLRLGATNHNAATLDGFRGATDGDGARRPIDVVPVTEDEVKEG